MARGKLPRTPSTNTTDMKLEIEPMKAKISYSLPAVSYRTVSHIEFWAVYHYLTEGIVASTDLAPYYSDEEIERNCEIQRRLRNLMEKGIIPPIQDIPVSAFDKVSDINQLSMDGVISAKERARKGKRRVLAFRLPNPHDHGNGGEIGV